MLFGKRKGQKRDSLRGGGPLISAVDARKAPLSLTGTACGRLRSVPLSFPKPFHQVPDGLPGTRACSLMPVSRLFSGLFFYDEKDSSRYATSVGLPPPVFARSCPRRNGYGLPRLRPVSPTATFVCRCMADKSPRLPVFHFSLRIPLRSPARTSVPVACRASAVLAAALSPPASPAPFPVWGG